MGIKAHLLRPVYLISKTPFPGVIHIPILSISFLKPIIDFSQYEGIIITSKQGVLALKGYEIDLKSLRWIAVSGPTAAALEEAGALEVETADGYGESIPRLLGSKQRTGKWLYMRPKVIASEWVDVAKKEGIEIDEAIVYETRCNDDLSQDSIASDGVLIFTSPSAVRCFREKYPLLPTHDIVVIGQTTQNALPEGILSHLSADTSIASTVELARKIAQAV